MEVLHLLNSLGSSSSEIAASLLSANAKGFKCQGDMCPVSNYLRSKGYASPVVDLTYVSYRVNNDFIEVLTPQAVEDFVGEFDEGLFPELIME